MRAEPPVVRFHLLRQGRVAWAVAPAFREAFPQILERLGGEAAAFVQGRAAHPVVALPDGRRVVARRLVHGGLLGPLLRDLYWGASRALRELVATLRAAEKGVPVPAAVAARTERIFAGFYRADLLTEEVSGAIDLGRLLREEWAGMAQPRRRAVIEAAARSVRAMHDAGLFHADLNLKNVLLRWEEGAPRMVLVDLDRCRFYRSLTFRQRRRNLWRLARSAEKLAAGSSRAGRAEAYRFLAAYADGDAALWERLRGSFRMIRPASFLRTFWWGIVRG